ncbi:MAG: hypothetical protein ACJ79K_14515 [Gemmatimonadaceae bacterium]
MEAQWGFGVILVLIGWVVSYRFGLSAGRTRAKEELAARRSQLATGLLVELRTLEQFLRRLRSATQPLNAYWFLPTPYLTAKLPQIDILSAPTVRALMMLHGIIADISSFRERYEGGGTHGERQQWYVRLKSTFALRHMRECKDQLVADGGLLPASQDTATVNYPELPELPPRIFPEMQFDYDSAGNILSPDGRPE